MMKCKIIKYTLPLLSLVCCLAACDVHEFPDIPESKPVNVRMNVGVNVTNVVQWECQYDGETMKDNGVTGEYDNAKKDGNARFIVRAYRAGNTKDYVQEKICHMKIDESDRQNVLMDLPPGVYDIMVWADQTENVGDTPFYNAEDFSEITLQGDHQGSNEFRDAFRGVKRVTVKGDIVERPVDTYDIIMERPMAKYEFVATDLAEFISSETTRVNYSRSKNQKGSSRDATTRVDIEDYRVVFYYTGFMPCAYSMFTDKPVDSSTGVMFESSLKRMNDTEASVGFDYVFTNGAESKVTVNIGIYDSEGEQLSMTAPITIPLKRNHHTVVRGSFLTTEASGGIKVNPGFDGNYNVVIP